MLEHKFIHPPWRCVGFDSQTPSLIAKKILDADVTNVSNSSDFTAVGLLQKVRWAAEVGMVKNKVSAPPVGPCSTVKGVPHRLDDRGLRLIFSGRQ